jgi:chemotaxis protein CheC
MSQERQEGDGTVMIDIRKLTLVNELARLGTNGVADNLGMLAGEDAEMEVTKTNFVDVRDIKSQAGDGDRVGVRVRLQDEPHGHILVLFPEDSAQRITGLMLADMVDDMGGVSSEMARSAITELGNMMVSGFIDGWADVLGQTIDHSTPQLVYAPAGEILERTAGLGNNSLALMFDSNISVPNSDIDADIYALPDLEEFVGMINVLDERRS